MDLDLDRFRRLDLDLDGDLAASPDLRAESTQAPVQREKSRTKALQTAIFQKGEAPLDDAPRMDSEAISPEILQKLVDDGVATREELAQLLSHTA